MLAADHRPVIFSTSASVRPPAPEAQRSADQQKNMDLVCISIREGHLTDEPAPSAEALLESHASGSAWGESIIQPPDSTSPRLLVSYHGSAGFQLVCCDSETSSGDCLASNTAMSAPMVEIELGGQAIEL